MYSTKRVNKNLVDGNAYITVGDKYHDHIANPFRSRPKGSKEPNPFRVKLIPINAENGNFSKLNYASSEYKNAIRYIDTQPLDSRKKGFGTKDAHRRDEFSNNIRTEQYREEIRKEALKMMEKSEMLKSQMTDMLASRTLREQERTLSETGFNYSHKGAQYDIGRTRLTEFDSKSSKDTYYKFDTEHPKRFGEMQKPESTVVGGLAWDVHYKPPAFGGKSEVKNFYDKSHLSVNQF